MSASNPYSVAAAQEYQHRRCPLCGADAPETTGSIRSRMPAELSDFETLRQQWYGFFREKSFFSYSRCANCGMLYAPKYFSEAQLAQLYASMPANMAEVDHDALGRTQGGYFRELQKHSNLSGDFMEIGPDIGLFARYCVQFGGFSRYWMFEPNVAAHENLRATLGSVCNEISTSLLDLSSVPQQSITVAAMIHVVDHIVDPVYFLKEVRAKLRPDARVMIVTHNERSLMARLLRERWPAYCLQHPHLFQPATMRRLMEEAGMKVVASVRSTNYFPVNFLIKHLLYALGLGSRNVPAWLDMQVPLRLGNTITIAAPLLR